MVMSFIKFAILSTMGELLGLRISTGNYFRKGFGRTATRRGMGHLRHGHQHGVRGILHRRTRLCRLPGRRTSPSHHGRRPELGQSRIGTGHFGNHEHHLRPRFHDPAQDYGHAHPCHRRHPARTVHPDTDGRHHARNELARAIGAIVFKKTIPFFWYPAHTITFLLPENRALLFAALLGVALGVILAVAARKK